MGSNSRKTVTQNPSNGYNTTSKRATDDELIIVITFALF